MGPLVAILLVIILVLLGGLAGVIFIWNKANTQLARYDSIEDVDLFRAKCEKEAKHFQAEATNLAQSIDQQKQQLRQYMEVVGVVKSATEAKQQLDEFRSQLEVARRQIAAVEDVANLQEVGFYQRRYAYDVPDDLKSKLDAVVARQKDMIKNKSACVCQTEWQVEGSVAKGRKMMDEQIRLMLRACNGECDAAIGKATFSNVDRIEQRIIKCFEALNKFGATKQISLNSEFLRLKVEELHLNYEYHLAKQDEKERQREIREQIREEQKAEKEIKAAQDKAEKEEALKQKALDDARRQLADEHGKHNEKLAALIAKLETELQEAIDRKAKAIARAQLTRSGHVYVLSNIGTMGHNVYKIGMTRRLEPLERVNELGGASVPFPFDVHAMIYTEDAPALENALHKKFDSRRINMVNLRREYFNVTLQEIRDAVAELHGLVTFVLEPEAEQYRTTIAMRKSQSPGAVA